jgi:hypothetical protein
MSGNGIRPMFIIRPKNDFTSGTYTSDHLHQMDYGLSRVSEILCLAYLFVSIAMLFKSSSMKNKIKESMGSASGRRLNCGSAFLVNVYALGFLSSLPTQQHATTLVSLSLSLSDILKLDSSLAVCPSVSKLFT